MLELNNIVDDAYTGIFSTVLTATFYRSTLDFPAPARANVILPITARSKNSSQMLVYPGDASVEINVPQNSAEAWLEVVATGAAEEEFWYTNILDRWRDYFPGSPMPGKGPLREVQVRVDGQLAGAFNPFPVIYTGGANPLLWRPLASLRAFDIPSFFLDITPFLPILCDGRSHSISFSVLGQGENGSICQHWAQRFITGALHIVLDTTDPPVRTTGRMLRYTAPSSPLILSLGLPSPDGKSLKTVVNASRRFDILAELDTGAGKKEVEVSGLGGFENTQYLTDRGDYEAVSQHTYSRYTSKHNNRTVLRDLSSFPLSITTNYTLFSTQHRFSAVLDAYGYDRSLTLPPALGGVEGRARRTKSSQRGAAEILGRNGRASYGWGRMEEEYAYHGDGGETYHEEVKAENATVVRRKRWGSLAPADRDLDRTSGRERVALPL
ncbi:uncharacterized protein JCM10292_004373 [Rhodotorula paludigena]|uniref:uncharacterized protein n=1 Tax=Rhodotorula paludigena TaxID=86838 RepID=UPI003182B182